MGRRHKNAFSRSFIPGPVTPIIGGGQKFETILETRGGILCRWGAENAPRGLKMTKTIHFLICNNQGAKINF